MKATDNAILYFCSEMRAAAHSKIAKNSWAVHYNHCKFEIFQNFK